MSLFALAGAAGAVPPAPTITASSGPHLATLSWQLTALDVNNGQPTSAYRIFRATSAAGPFSEVQRFYAPVPGGFADGSVTVYNDATASPAFGNSYTYYVSVFDALNLSSDSSLVTVTPQWSGWHMARGDSYRSGRSIGAVPKTPYLLWTGATGNNAPYNIIQHAGYIFGPGQLADIYSYDAFTGAQPYSLSLGSSIYYSTPVIGPNGRLYASLDVTNATSSLTAHATPTLTEYWENAVVEPKGTGVARMDCLIAANGNIIWGNDNGDAVATRDLGTSGATVWISSDPTGSADGDAVSLMNGNIVFVRRRAAPPHDVVCMTPSGAVVWTRTVDGTMCPRAYAAQLAVGPQGWLYVGTTTLYVLDQNGNYVWQYLAPGSITGIATDVDGTSCIATEGALFRIQSISAAGTLRWSTTVHGDVTSEVTPPVLTSDGSVMVSYQYTSNPKNLGIIAVRESDGKFLWEYDTNGSQTFTELITGPMITPDGRIYAAFYNAIYGLASPATVNLTKTASPVNVHAGSDLLTYTLSWSNASGMTGTNLSLWDTLPANLTYAAGNWGAQLEPGATATMAYATTSAGPWTPGEPADGTGSPLVLRWQVSLIGGLHQGKLWYGTKVIPTTPDGTWIGNSASGTVYDGSATIFLQSAIASATVINQFTVPNPLTAVGQNTQISLNWGPAYAGGSQTVSSYLVFRAACAACAYTQIGSTLPAGPGSPTVTWFIDSGLVNGTPYWYKVQAKDNLGTLSSFSATVSGAADGTVIDPPATCTAGIVPGTGNRVEVDWSIVTGSHPATAYAVFRSTFAGVPDVELKVGGAVGMSSTACLDPVEAAGTYWFYVRALGSVSDPSPFSLAVTISGTPPSTPGWLTAVSGAGVVNLQWAVSTPGTFAISGYRIYRATYATGWNVPASRPPVLATIWNPAATVYADFGVTNGLSVFYTVDAFDNQAPRDESGNTNQVQGNPGLPPGPPPSIRVVTTEGIGPIQAVVGWTGTSTGGTWPVQSFEIWRGTYPAGMTPLTTVPTSTSVITDSSGVLAGVPMFYKVRALDVYGMGSTFFSPTTFGIPYLIPNAPTGVGTAPLNSEIDLNWTGGTQATYPVAGTYVYRSLSTGTELYAPVNSGPLGPWNAGNNLANAREIHAMATWNGYVYAIAGDYNNGTATVRLNSVEYAAIQPNGALGPWFPATPVPIAVRAMRAFAYRGKLYIAGGQDTGAVVRAEVYMANINPDGSLGAWQTLNPLPTGRIIPGLVAVNDYLYSVAGYTAGAIATVNYARIYPDGTIGPWGVTTSTPQPLDSAATCVAEGRIYVSGGLNGAVQSTVYYAVPNVDGTITAWTTATAMPQVRYQHWMLSSKGKVYVGNGFTTAVTNSIYVAPILSTGALGAWTPVANAPLTAAWVNAVEVNDRLYSTGGQGVPSHPEVYLGSVAQNLVSTPAATYADAPLANGTTYFYELRSVDAQGNLSAISTEITAVPTNTIPSAPQMVHAAPNDGVAPAGVRIGWSIVGAVPAVTSYQIYRGLSAGAETPFVTMVDATNTTSMYLDASAAAGIRYYYQVSALNVNRIEGARSFEVYATPFMKPASPNPVDTISGSARATVTWTLPPQTTYPLSGYFVYRSTFSGGELTCPLGATGTGAWGGNINSLPAGMERFQFGMSAMDGQVFIGGGGHSQTVGDDQNTVLSAQVFPDGSLGSWTLYPPAPAKRYDTNLATVNGKVYLIGGTEGSTVTTTVWMASVLPTGTLSPWIAATPLPAARSGHSVAVYDNWLYVIGGRDTTATVQATVYMAPILPNGLLGQWATTNALPAIRQLAGTAVVDKWVYVTGGNTGAKNSAATTVYRGTFIAGGGVTWNTETTVLPVKRQGAAAFGGTGQLFVAAGSDGANSPTYYSDVIVARVGPTGVLSAFATTSAIGTATQSPAGAYVNGVGVITGGMAGAGAATNTSWVSKELRNQSTDPLSSYTDLAVANGAVYYYQVRSMDVLGNLSATSIENRARPANYFLTIKAKNPESLYAQQAGDSQLYRFTYSMTGTDTMYNVTMTTMPFGFSNRNYQSPSLSTTLTGGSTVIASYAASLAGPWTTGEPPNNTTDPLYLRWTINQVLPGRSGAISYRVATVAGGPQVLLPAGLSATLSSDPTFSGYSNLGYTSTTVGKRIEAPETWVKTTDGVFRVSGDDQGLGIASTPGGGWVVAGSETVPGQGTDWRVSLYNAAGALTWTVSVNGSANAGDAANAVLVTPSGSVYVAGMWATGTGNDWLVRRYDPAGNFLSSAGTAFAGNEAAWDIAADASDNIYVAGATASSGASDDETITKYSPGLVSQWTRTFSSAGVQSDIGRAVAVDAAGNVYLAGNQNPGAITMGYLHKLDPAGNLLWTRTASAGTPASWATSVAVDRNGYVVVAGVASSAGIGDWSLLKFDANGNLVWVRTYGDPSGNDDNAQKVTVDAAGNYVVAGWEQRLDNNTAWNGMIRKYDNAGNLLFSATHDGLQGPLGDDRFFGIAPIAGSQDVLVTGQEVVAGDGKDVVTERFTMPVFTPPAAPSGLNVTSTVGTGAIGLQWTPSIAGTNPTIAGYRIYRQTFAGVLPTAQSFVVFVSGAGTTTLGDGPLTLDQRYYYRISAVDSAGAESPLSMESSGVPYGPLNLTLYAKNPAPLYVNIGDAQLWQMTFSNGGTETLYNLTLTTADSSFIGRTYLPGSLTVTLTGGAVIGSSANAASLSGPWTAGMPAGAAGDPLYLRWVLTQVAPGRSGVIGYQTTTVGPAGTLVLPVGFSATSYLDPALTFGTALAYTATAAGERIDLPLKWLYTEHRSAGATDNAYGAAADSGGNALVVGSGYGPGSLDWMIRKFSPTGALVWSRGYNGPLNGYDEAFGVAVGPGDSVIVGGYENRVAGQGNDQLLQKYDSAGTLLWSRTYNSPTNGDDQIFGVAVNTSGTIAVAGEITQVGEGYNWIVRSFDPAGNLLWSRTYNSPASQNEAAYGVAIDASGNVYAAGVETRGDLGQQENWLINKYAADGTMIWTKSFNGPSNASDTARAIALDPNGNVIVAGWQYDSWFDWVVRKYDPGGNVLWSRTYSAPGTSLDQAYGVTTDSAGNVTVVGKESNCVACSFNQRLIRWDDAGNQLDSIVRDGVDGDNETGFGAAAIPGSQDVAFAAGEVVRDEMTDYVAGRYALSVFLPPTTPPGLAATGVAGAINLGWSLAAPGTRGSVAGYNIYRQTFAGVTEAGLLVNVAGATTASYVDTAVVPGATYFYRIVALDGAGAVSLLSNETSATVPCVVSLAVTKSVSTATPSIGQPVNYQVVIANTGFVTVTNLTVMDTVSPRLVSATTFAPSGWASPAVTQSAGGTLYVWSAAAAGLLPPGASFTITISGAAGFVCAPATVSDTTIVTAASACSVGQAASSPAVFAIQPAVANVTYTSQQVPASPAAGGPISYRLTLINIGAATMTSMMVTDTIATGVVSATASEPSGFPAPAVISVPGTGSLYVWSASGSLLFPPGATMTFTVTGMVASVCTTTSVSNTAYWIASSPCVSGIYAWPFIGGMTLNAPATSLVVNQQPVPATPPPGNPVTYQIVVTNTGASTLQSLTITDTISAVVVGSTAYEPAGYPTPVMSQAAGGTLFVWSASGLSIPPGLSLTFTIAGSVGTVAATTVVSNTAMVTAADSCGGPVSAMASPVVFTAIASGACQPLNLTLHARHPEPLYVSNAGIQFWRLSFSNAGAGTLYAETVTAQVIGGGGDRTYVASSLSATITGGGVLVASAYAATLAGPWTAGDNFVGAEPFYLRWVVSALYPGASGEISFRTTAFGASQQLLPVSYTATSSCDSAQTLAQTLDYSTTGTGELVASPLLAVTLGHGAGGLSNSWSVATDASGNVVEGGADLVANVDWHIRKYDPTLGTLLASTLYNEGIGSDYVMGLTVDPAGSVVAVGQDTGAGAAGTDWRIIKYNSALTAILATTGYNDAVNGFDRAVASVVDTSGNIFVVGVEAVTGGSWDWRINKYNSTLTTLLSTTNFSGPGLNYDDANAVALDPAGNVVVAGSENDPVGGDNWSIRKYNPTLTALLGATTYDGPAGNSDSAQAVAVDASGNIYTAGYEVGTSGGWNWRIIKYDASLSATLATASYDGPAGGSDQAYAARFDAAGNLVVVGSEAGVTGGQNWAVRKYDDNLNLLDAQVHDGVNGSTDALHGVATYGTGTVYAAGEENVYDDGQSASTARYLLLPFTPPVLLPGLAATAYSGSVGLQWNPATASSRSAIGTYRIFRTTYPGLSEANVLATVVGATASTFVDTAVVAGTTYFYRVVAADLQGAESALTNEASASVSACVPASLGVVQVEAPSNPQAGGPVTYTVVITNTGAATITGLTITDTISPVIVSATASEPSGFPTPAIVGVAGTGTLFAWSGGGLIFAPGAVWTFTISGFASAICATTTISNTVFVAGTSACSATAMVGNVTLCTPQSPTTGLSVVAIQAPVNPVIGQPVRYQIVVGNSGSATVTNVLITDTISAVLVSATTDEPSGLPSPVISNAPGSGTLYVWSVAGANFAPGATWTFTVSGLAGPVCAVTAVSNSAYVAGVSSCGSTLLTVSATTFAVSPAAFSWTQSIVQTPLSPSVGAPVSYRIMVTNSGTATIDNLTVTDTLSPVIVNQVADVPAGYTLNIVQAAAGTRYEWTGNAGTVLSPGVTLTVTLSGLVGQVCAATTVSNSAFVVSSRACGINRSTFTSLGFSLAAPVMSFTAVKTQTTAGTPNSQVTYAIRVANTGTVTIDNLTIDDTVAASVVNVLTAQSVGFGTPVLTAVAGTGTRYEWTGLGLALAPGTDLTVTVTGQFGVLCAATTISNTAVVAGGTSCAQNTVQTNAVAVTVVAPSVAVLSTMQQAPAAPGIGSPVTYQIIVTNTGAASLSNVRVVDTVSAVLVGVTTAQPAGYPAPTLVNVAPSGTAFIWNAGPTLNPGQTFTFTITGFVSAICASKTFSNTGYVEPSTACAGSLGGTLTAPTAFTITAPVSLVSVAATQTPASPGPGATVAYRLVVANAGTATIDNLDVTDTISPVVTAAVTDQPAGFAIIGPSQVSGGTRFEWSGSGLSLIPGAAFTFTITGTVGTVCVQTTVSDTAFAATSNACGLTTAGTAASGFTLPGPTLTVAATMNQTTPGGLNAPITYRIDVANTGAATITDLVVTDTVAAQVVVSSTDRPAGFGGVAIASVAGSGTRYSWTGNSLNFLPGTTLSFTITGQMGTVCAATAVSNTALVGAATACAEMSAPSNNVNATDPATAASFSVAGLFTPSSAGVGVPLTFRIVVANSGSATLSALTVTDTAPGVFIAGAFDQPAGFGAPSVGQSSSGTMFTWSGGPALAPGAAFTFTITGAVGNLCALSAVSSTIAVGASTSCGPVFNVTAGPAFLVTPPNPGSVLALQQIPGAPAAGSPVAYQIVIKNLGEVTITNINAVDTISPVVTGVTVDQPAGFGAPIVTSTASGTRYDWSGGPVLSPGASFTFTITGVVGTVCSASTVSNTAYVTGAFDCSSFHSLSLPKAFVMVAPALGYTLSVAQTPASPQIGDSIQYDLIVNNTGAATIDALTIVDTVGPGIEGLFTTHPGSMAQAITSIASGTRFVWSGGGLNLAPGGSMTISVYGAMSAVCAATSVSNTAYAVASTACTALGQFSNAVGTLVAPPGNGLTIVSTHVPTSPVAAGPVTYTVVVTNTGASTVIGLTITDTLPAQVTFGSETHTAGLTHSAVGAVHAWSGALTLSPGMSATVTLDGTVSCGGGLISNTGWVQASYACGPAEAASPADTFSVAGAVLTETVNLQEISSPTVNAAMTYRIIVANTGSATIDTLTVTDTIASTIVPFGTAQPASFAAPVVTGVVGTGTRFAWSGTALNFLPGTIMTFTITGQVGTLCTAATITNTAFVTAGTACGQNTLESNVVSLAAPAGIAALSMVSSHTPASPAPSSAISYLLVVTNTGTATLTGVTVSDTLPAQVIFGTEVHGGGWTSVGTAAVHAWTFANPMTPGVSFTFTVTGTTTCAGGTATNNGWIAAIGDCGAVQAAGPADSFTLIAPTPGVALLLTHTPASPAAGAGVTYTLLVVNTGTATLTGLSVTDTLPAGVTYATDSNTGGLVHGSVGQLNAWTGALTLAPAMTVTITLDGTLACAAAVDSSTAFVFATAACGAVQASSGDDALNVPAPASFAAAIAGPAVVSVGQTYTVTLTVTNTGGTNAGAVLPSLDINAGAVSVVSSSGGLPSLPGGSSAYFSWTLSVSGAGPVALTLSATGSACGAPLIVAKSLGETAQTAATLTASLTALPTPVSTGQPIVLSLTVTNTGQATATGVSLAAVEQSVLGGATAVGTWNPAPPVTLAGGTSITFTWTYTASTSGLDTFSTTPTGSDANTLAAIPTGVVSSGPVTITTGASLVAAIYASATTVSMGQPITLVMTVTNTGGASALLVAGEVWAGGGSGAAGISAPTPGSVATLAAGAGTTFMWTVTATGSGVLTLTGSATGTGPVASGQKSVTITIQTAAALTAGLSLSPASVCQGQGYQVRLTLNNTGSAAVTGLSVTGLLDSGAGQTLVAAPAIPAGLAGNSGVVLTWTYTGSVPGTDLYSLTVSGQDVNSLVSAGVVVAGSGVFTVATGGVLAASWSAPANAAVGQIIPVVLTVTNTGDTTATINAVGMAVSPVAGSFSAVSPATPQTVAAGAARSFTWNYTVGGSGGTLSFTGTASGTTCGAIVLTATAGGTLATVNPASLAAAIAVSSASVVAGQWVTVSLTVTNTGGATVNTLVPSATPTGSAVLELPLPATLGSLAPGASATFVWSFSTSGAGTATFTAGVFGTDAVTSVAVSGVASGGGVTVKAPASLSMTVVLSPAGNVTYGATVTGVATITNSGGTDATVVAPFVRTVPGSLTQIVAPTALPLPVTAGGGTATITFAYIADRVCGSASLYATANGTEAGTGRALTTGAQPSNVVGIAGSPTAVVVTSSAPSGEIHGTVTLTAVVYSGCGTPVPGQPVAWSAIAGGGSIAPANGVTDASGTATATVQLGPLPGANALVVTVPGGPSATVYVTGTPPSKPEPFLSKNFFDPSRGERVQVRIMVPAAMRVGVRIYNLAGELVRVVRDADVIPGLTVWEWDGRTQGGDTAGNGIYFIQIQSGTDVQIKRVIVLKR